LLSLILPAYNEARRLPASLLRCADFLSERGLPAEIIVVDDGSTDGTPHAYATAVDAAATMHVAFRYVPIAHAGKGAAVRAGVRAAAGDPIVFLDSDLTIPVEILDRFLSSLDDGADVVIASRFVRGSVEDRPWWRRLMSVTFRAFVRTIVPTGVEDTQCGGKAYTAEAARLLFGQQRLDGFAFDAEVLYIARLRGLRVVEVPFELHQRTDTTIDFLADAPRMLADLFRIRWNAARGRYT
jgi:glycosyltransferase involved in cell wall biosynthesis